MIWTINESKLMCMRRSTPTRLTVFVQKTTLGTIKKSANNCCVSPGILIFNRAIGYFLCIESIEGDTFLVWIDQETWTRLHRRQFDSAIISVTSNRFSQIGKVGLPPVHLGLVPSGLSHRTFSPKYLDQREWRKCCTWIWNSNLLHSAFSVGIIGQSLHFRSDRATLRHYTRLWCSSVVNADLKKNSSYVLLWIHVVLMLCEGLFLNVDC